MAEPDPRAIAVDDWRDYCRDHGLPHDFDDPHGRGMQALGYLDGARALAEFAECCCDEPITVEKLQQYVEELRLCYCAHFNLDPNN